MAQTQRLKVVCFSFGILEQGGGFENFLITLTNGLADTYRDLDITIVTMSPRIVEKLQHVLSVYFLKKQDSKSIYRESHTSIVQRLGRVQYVQAASLRELRMLLRDGDILYTKNELLELATLRLTGTKQLPSIMTGIHTPLVYPNASSLSEKLHNMLYGGFLYKWLIKPVTAVHVSNQADYDYVRRTLKPQYLELLPQPIGFKAIAESTTHQGKLRLLFVGRLTAVKGTDLLQDIIAELDKRYPGRYVLKIAGSGEPSAMHAFTVLSKENKAVEYLGHVDNDRINALYQWTDITLITSTYETLSKAAIEASMSKRIVVSTDIAGPREVVVDGKTGFLLPPSPAAFCQKIVELDALRHRAPKAFASIGQLAHRYVQEKFSEDVALTSFHRELWRLVAA